MKVEVNSQALADAVAWTTRVIDARPASPILAGIRLEAIDGTLQLSAFNYAISARHHIEAGIDEAGSVLVLGKLLADDEDSYRYLIESIRRFPTMPEFEGMIRAAGFRHTKVEPILGGLVAIHSGWKV